VRPAIARTHDVARPHIRKIPVIMGRPSPQRGDHDLQWLFC
jgi:hypothetical protein